MTHALIEEYSKRYRCRVTVNFNAMQLAGARIWCVNRFGFQSPDAALTNPDPDWNFAVELSPTSVGKTYFFFDDEAVAVEFKLRFG